MTDFTENDKNIKYKLQIIEQKLQQSDSNSDVLKQVVSDLKDVVQSMDKEFAIHSEKQSHLFFRIEQIQKEVDSVGGKGDKTSEKHRDLLENALMVIVGGVLAYLLSMAKG